MSDEPISKFFSGDLAVDFPRVLARGDDKKASEFSALLEKLPIAQRRVAEDRWRQLSFNLKAIEVLASVVGKGDPVPTMVELLDIVKIDTERTIQNVVGAVYGTDVAS